MLLLEGRLVVDDEGGSQEESDMTTLMNRSVVVLLLLLFLAGLEWRSCDGLNTVNVVLSSHRPKPKLTKTTRRSTIPLDLAIERDVIARGEPPIATITWFHYQNSRKKKNSNGDGQQQQQRHQLGQVSKLLQDNVLAVIQQNPWIAGRVVVDGDLFSGLQPRLEYQEEIQDNNNLSDHQIYQRVVLPSSENEDKVTSSTTTTNPNSMYLATLPYTCIDEKTGPLMRVTLLENSNNIKDEFAVIVSVSHAVADITTFYELHSMILSSSSSSLPYALNMTSIVPNEDERVRQLLGKDTFDLQHNIPSNLIKGALGLINKLIFKRNKSEQYFYLVDERVMTEYKNRALADSPLSEDVPFLSTNDILTQWFFSQSQCTVGLMCIDYRKRLLQQLSSTKLGRNHWGAIAYQQTDVRQHPNQIRKSLVTLRRVGSNNDDNSRSVLPTPFQFATQGTLGIASSWVNNNKRWSISGCDTGNHLPLYDFATYCPSGFCVMRTFTYRPGRTGVYLAGDPRMMEQLTNNLPPFCKPLT